MNYLENSEHCSDRHFDHREKKQIIAARHVSWAQNYQNCGRGSASAPTRGVYNAPPDPLAEFQGNGRGKVRGKGKRQGGRRGREVEREGLPKKRLMHQCPWTLLGLFPQTPLLSLRYVLSVVPIS